MPFRGLFHNRCELDSQNFRINTALFLGSHGANPQAILVSILPQHSVMKRLIVNLISYNFSIFILFKQFFKNEFINDTPAVVSHATRETTCYQIAGAVRQVEFLLSIRQIYSASVQHCLLRTTVGIARPKPALEQHHSWLK